MSLITRFRNFFKRGRAGATTDTGVLKNSTFSLAMPWATDISSRKEEEKVLDRMDDEDGIIGTGLDAIADCATTFPDPDMDKEFYVETENTRARDVIDALLDRTGLDSQVWDITRAMVKKANHFVELVIGRDGNIVRLKQFPYSYQINKNVDDFGNMLDGDPVQAMKNGTIGVAPYDQIIDNMLVSAFYSWQIVHFMYGRSEGRVYAKAALAREYRNWQRLQYCEDSVAIARMIRAYDRLVHQVPIPMGATLDEMEEYLKQYRDSILKKDLGEWDTTQSKVSFGKMSNPTSVSTDLFLPRFFNAQGQTIDGEVNSVGGTNPHITRLDDLDRSLNRILCALKVPAKYLNYDIGRRTFVATGNQEQDEQFGRTLRGVQKAVKRGLYQIIDTELVLAGIDPQTVDYSIIMPPIAIRAEAREADVAYQRAKTAAIWRELGIPADIVFRRLFSLSSDELVRAAQATYDMRGVAPNGDDANDNPA